MPKQQIKFRKRTHVRSAMGKGDKHIAAFRVDAYAIHNGLIGCRDTLLKTFARLGMKTLQLHATIWKADKEI